MNKLKINDPRMFERNERVGKITMSDNLKTSFTIDEIDDMLNGKILERNGVYYCIYKHTMMYCRDLDTDIWVAFNGVGGIV